MSRVTRRSLLSGAFAGSALHLANRSGSLLFAKGAPQPRAQSPQEQIKECVGIFMQKFDVPGVSVAIRRGNESIDRWSFGRPDVEKSDLLNDSYLFRIASISKTFTSVGIFLLVEDGKLKLTDKVFGKGAALEEDYGTPPYHPYITDITVDHLLTHTSGAWHNDSSDPMFRFRDLNAAKLLGHTLDHSYLTAAPPQKFCYSNFGYFVLGRVIEKKCRQPYADFIREKILDKCRISDMVIAGNTPGKRLGNEVAYYGQGEDPYSMNVSRMDSHGGWLATASDLVQFASSLHLILKENSVRTMLSPLTPCPPSAGPVQIPADCTKPLSPPCIPYARGWSVRGEEHGHNGSLPGTSTNLLCTENGICCAVLTNTRRQPTGIIDSDLDKVTRKIIEIYSTT
jgi:CubicO group peptidase (beta-lactamase class C family)